MNDQRFDRWMLIYERKLKEALAEPNAHKHYTYGPDRIPGVIAKMRVAFGNRTYNKDGRAIVLTCRELKIKHTYAAINAWLDGSDV